MHPASLHPESYASPTFVPLRAKESRERCSIIWMAALKAKSLCGKIVACSTMLLFARGMPWEDAVKVTYGTPCGFPAPTRVYAPEPPAAKPLRKAG